MYGSSGSASSCINGTSGSDSRHEGIIPRAMVDIFKLSSSEEILSLSVYCSFLQIYNEHLYDMLRCDTVNLVLCLLSITCYAAPSRSLCLRNSVGWMPPFRRDFLYTLTSTMWPCYALVITLPSFNRMYSVVWRRDPHLLNPLTLRENSKGVNATKQQGKAVKQRGEEETYVQGLSEFSVKSVGETFELLRTAEKNRKTRETDMNSFSSRSHSIFQVSRK